MNDGRLDEAYALAADESVRRHRRGQELVGRLARALLSRCREHLGAGRLSQALTDSDKAGRLAGSTPSVAQAAADVAAAMAARREVAGRQGADEANIRRHIDDGRLTLAAGLVDHADQSAETTQRRIARKRQAADDVAKRTQDALDRGDWVGAVDEILAGRTMGVADNRLTSMTAHVTELMGTRIRSAFSEGRIDRAAFLTDRLAELAGDRVDTRELMAILDQCRRAAAMIDSGQHRPAAAILRRLAGVYPEASWLTDTAGTCDTAAQASEALHAGPLGLLEMSGTRDHGESITPTSAPAPATPITAQAAPTERLGPSFLLRLDGVGGYLVARGDCVSIGPISSGERPILGLVTDPTAPVARFERIDGDYFLRCDQPVAVNDEPTTDRLLIGGERIALSHRCRMRFERPNAASTSAVVSLSGARLPIAEAREVILMDREIVVGSAPTAHIRADQRETPVVFTMRDDRLLCKATVTAAATNQPLQPDTPLPTGEALRIGSVTMVISML